MGIKLEFDDKKKYIYSLPGPGTHQPTVDYIKQRQPTYSMGQRFSSVRDTRLKEPGPGQYLYTSEITKQKSPSFGFGTSTRQPFGSSKFSTPGPGTYKIPVRFQDVPEFMLPDRPDESKYV
jgi:hypothetical protein